jgi:flagellar motor switch protein FliM
MPIETFVEIPVYINGNPVYMAKMGEQNGKMAVSIV